VERAGCGAQHGGEGWSTPGDAAHLGVVGCGWGEVWEGARRSGGGGVGCVPPGAPWPLAGGVRRGEAHSAAAPDWRPTGAPHTLTLTQTPGTPWPLASGVRCGREHGAYLEPPGPWPCHDCLARRDGGGADGGGREARAAPD